MNRNVYLGALCIIFAFFSSPVIAQIEGSVGPDGFIVISGDGVGLVGLDLESLGGHLIPIPGEPPSAEPFQFLLSNTEKHVTFGNLGSVFTLDGNLVLPVGYDGTDPANDLLSFWGGRASDTPIAFVVNAPTFTPATTDPIITDPIITDPIIPEPSSSSLTMCLVFFGLLGMTGMRRRS